VTPTATVATVQNLVVNGGTLDLKGADQAVQLLSNNNAIGGTGGTITSATAANFITTGTTAATFSGNLGGALNLYKANTSTLTLTGSNAFSGAANIVGGGLTLRDSGALTGTSAVYLTGAALTYDNSGLAAVSNRLGTATINSRSSTLSFNGRVINSTQDSISLGALNLDSGVTVLANSTNAASITFASLNRNATAGATLNLFPFTGVLGKAGAGNTNIQFTAAPTLTNNIIGAWAIYSGIEWMTYSATPNAQGGFGLGVLGDTANGFAAYDFVGANTLTGYTPSASANVKITGVATAPITVPTVGGNFFANTLNLQSTVNGGGLAFANATDTVNLTAGGLLHVLNFTATIGTTALPGQLTAGGATPAGPQDLNLYNNQSTLTVNSKIIDNGASAVRLIASSFPSNNATIQLSAANT
jgi:autotransporter-associated beta strand protein